MTRGVLFTPRLFGIGDGPPPIRGAAVGELPVVRDAALVWEKGRVTYAGPAAQVPDVSYIPPERRFRSEGAVVPGFVDCHTHLPFFGWREDEFEARLAGRSYRDLHGEGGIYRSARMLSEASDQEVIDFCLPLAFEMAAHGTTAVELKTGYGLSLEAELRQARLAREIARRIPQTAVVTLLVCHAVPRQTSRDQWVDVVCRELIPKAAGEGLADAVDVFVEDIAFGVADLQRVAEVARAHGLMIRCHADQLGGSGATEAAVQMGARSADHLNHIGPGGVAALGSGPTAGVLLPVSTFFLRTKPPPVSELLSAGAALAVATDFNPGTSPCLSIPEAMVAATSLYGLSPLAALGAATLNAAWVLGVHDILGSLRPGKRADFLVLDHPDPAMVPYRPGHNPVVQTWIGGERVGATSR